MTFAFGFAFWLAPITGLIALVFSIWLYLEVKKLDRGTEKMQEVQDAIMEGSKAFIRRQYQNIAIIGFVVTLVIYLALDLPNNNGVPFGAIAFILGVGASLAAGAIAMLMAAETNGRTTNAAKESRSAALETAYKGGLVLGMSVVAFSIIGISILFFFYSLGDTTPEPSSIIAFGFGASFAALFAQLGGGIFTKSADVGADLVGKIEEGIPEDDPRNPGVVADNVGDAVGDCAGRGADLFESISGETIGAMIVGLLFYIALADAGLRPGFIIGFIIFPLVARGISMLGTIGTMPIVKLDDDEDMIITKDEDGNEVVDFEGNPMRPMSNAFYATSLFSLVVFAILILTMLGGGSFIVWPLILSAGIGILLAVVTLWVTDYYTGDHQPVMNIVDNSTTGAATNIITGLSVGMMSTWAPMLSLVVAIVSSYFLGVHMTNIGAENEIIGAVLDAYPTTGVQLWGIFSTTIATMAMLSVTPMVLTMDGYGPIADQSGGIAEMSDAGEDVRQMIDSLDMVGNTTKALAKGYGMTSAGLAALLLFQAYLQDLEHLGFQLEPIDIIRPSILAGLFIGALLPFVFTAFSLRSVGNAAGDMINEIRRQFAEDGEAIMKYEKKPDYAVCVDVATQAALREMVVPSLIVVITPILVGLIFGALPLAAFLIGATGSGILLGLTLNNSGGAWDNAKKTIEAGMHGGKGSSAHEAAVIGDTVGDPTKDTSGPSIHVLIKLINTIAITMVPILVAVPPLLGGLGL